ncbi:hypothetical protein [Sphaerotilus montanus]|uniref:hypothetical protein n=1 Tax=Sphaerotilus montanus TaxID=522889 RepID=UPI003FA2EB8E
MSAEDLLRSLNELMRQTNAEERLSAFRGYKHGRPKCEHSILDAAFDLYISGVLVTREIVVALVHGIRTSANWQEKVRESFCGENNVKVYPIGYGYFDVFRFIGPLRSEPIKRVRDELRDLRRIHPECDLVVVAHSFGTYIISKILSNSPDIRISRILLCGSIIPEDYRWNNISLPLNQNTLINEVGTKDYWPVVARVVSLGYGGSGSFGFKTARVLDRYFDYGHSDFFTKEHFDNFWRPFILDGKVVRSPWDSQRPTPSMWLSFLGGVPMVKLWLSMAIILIVFLGFNLVSVFI